MGFMTSTPFSQEEILRYSRHLMVPEIGMRGQQRLKSASVLIVGAGGLGSPAALYLAAAGVGRLGLVDDDLVDRSNLQRQVMHGTSQIARAKVDSARERLTDLNPHIQVDAIFDSFNYKTAEQIADGYDLLLDCCDNFETRYLINDLCVLSGRPEVYGAIYRFEGQVSVFDAKRGPCYRCLFPTPPEEGAAPACGEAGVFNITPGVIGTLQAVEALKLLLGIGDPLIGRLLLFDGLAMSFKEVKLHKNPDCHVCSEHPQIRNLANNDPYCKVELGPSIEDEAWLSPRELADGQASARPPLLLDVRDAVERQVSGLEGAVAIPLEHLEERLGELDMTREIVVFCRTGSRSKRAVKLLLENGFSKAKFLKGGINAWAVQINPGMFTY